jgi:hypothetical protein
MTDEDKLIGLILNSEVSKVQEEISAGWSLGMYRDVECTCLHI